MTAAAQDNSEDKTSTAGVFTLWQLPEQTHSQMNGYILRTGRGRIVVIDGGTTGDAPYLRGFLGALGNHVDWWFISHMHSDHTEAPAAILKDPRGIRVEKLFGSLPSERWLRTHSLEGDIPPLDDFVQACSVAGTTVTDVLPGSVMELDGVRFEILAGRNEELTMNALNNQSLVMRVTDSRKSVLFTGDLGEEAGDKLLSSVKPSQLQADYIQMTHHGQNGANEKFYRTVSPKACLWPTPKWLWDNDNGGGKGSGPWTTLETRAWMERLGVQKHYLSAEGLHRID